MRKKLIGIVIICLAILGGASTVSKYKFNVANPLASLRGMIELAKGKDTIEIQSEPKVVIAKSEKGQELFIDYIEDKGYKCLADRQLGALHVIDKEGKEEVVYTRINGYYQVWEWEN